MPEAPCHADADRRALRTGWSVAAVALLGGVGGGVVFPILPVLGLRLGLSAAMVGLILAANRITRIVFNPVSGSLLDRFGARWPVAAGLCLESVAVLAFSVALHVAAPAPWFLGGRVVWGIGSSLLMVGSLAAILTLATPATRGRLTGRVRTAMTLGLPAGMLLGGVIADLASPNAAFLFAAAVTLLSGAFALFILPRGKAASVHADTRRDGPVWRGMLRNPMLQIIWLSNALIFFAVGGVLLATLVVLVDARGIHVLGLGSQGSAGLLMAWLMLFRAMAALGAGAMLDREPRRTRLLLPAALLSAVGFVGLDLAHGGWSMGLALAVIGLGSGALTIPVLALLGEATSPRMHGRAMGLYQVYGDIGGSLGPIVGLQLGAVTGYGPIYAGIALAMLAATVPLALLARHEHRNQR